MSNQRPSERDPGLRFIVEWMDETFAKNDGQSYFFSENLRANNESFKIFMDKKYKAFLVEQERPPAKIYQLKKLGGKQ